MQTKTDKTKASGKAELPLKQLFRQAEAQLEHEAISKIAPRIARKLAKAQQPQGWEDMPEGEQDAWMQANASKQPQGEAKPAKPSGEHTPQTSRQWAQRAGEQQGRIESLEGERDSLRNHADKLADALRDLRSRVVAERPNCLNTTKADEVLADYEEASKQ